MISALGRWRLADLSEFEASLVYKRVQGQSVLLLRETCLEKQNKKQTKKVHQ